MFFVRSHSRTMTRRISLTLYWGSLTSTSCLEEMLYMKGHVSMTLVVTVEMVRQSEEVALQVSMQGETTGAVHEVTHKHSKHTKNYIKPNRGNGGKEKCECVKVRHNKDENCWHESTCNTCNKIGQWSRVCRNRRAVSEVTEQQQSYFLGAVNKAADGSSEKWAVKLLVGSTLVEFKIDTGRFP